MTKATTERGGTTPAPRWAVWAAYAVPLCVLPSAVWRTTEAFNGDTSMADEGWYLLLLSALSLGFAMLTPGLVHRWGERVPEWVPGVGGRVIPARLVVTTAVVGASLVLALCLYGVLNTVFRFVDRAPVLVGPADAVRQPPGWDVGLLYLPILAWGPIVLVLAAAYRRRRTTASGMSGPAAPGAAGRLRFVSSLDE
ncbi:hypothetical protein LX15_002440 [Streptoalloteichus tenebrarius]|uniref:Uncharacterized protein n=1 Tax=Streptoalloteichus tenebrarius (strain ATCC 17920 / DSM 40477 / JCM 4838 / CBS 697.72 / NBRC 16177 / NCIMB 11028 / NRRL B-12390 / A12253. 1 / ISP 5477) TaxID=1933 RepID=A0ABT1HTB2_STRSD|nr:hypothetical protein [Streptoalloteichus tenebrarius]MCP2258742.1 hypothetical protein [Streptoalloteichus tenebrarius]BFF02896.1 hypothetical protein GCM10020241_45710 [Streptoalloteichus tenebrarius]